MNLAAHCFCTFRLLFFFLSISRAIELCNENLNTLPSVWLLLMLTLLLYVVRNIYECTLLHVSISAVRRCTELLSRVPRRCNDAAACHGGHSAHLRPHRESESLLLQVSCCCRASIPEMVFKKLGGVFFLVFNFLVLAPLKHSNR